MGQADENHLPSEEEGESEEYSDEEDDDYNDLDYLDDNSPSNVTVMTDSELEFYNDDPPLRPGAYNHDPIARAARAKTSTENFFSRSTFICLNEDIFRAQLEKEEKKSTQSIQPTGPTRSLQKVRSQTRATFISINQQKEKILIIPSGQAPAPPPEEEEDTTTINQIEQQPVTTTPKPPRPERPARPPRSNPPSQTNLLHDSKGPVVKTPPPPPPKRQSTLSLIPSSPKKKETPVAFTKLLESEREYVKQMEIIENTYMTEIRKEKLLTTYEFVSLFSTIEDILPLNKKILEELEKLEKSTNNITKKNIFDLFNTHVQEISKIYSIYCSNQPNVNELINEYKQQNSEFSEFLEACVENGNYDLPKLLSFPLERLSEYLNILENFDSFDKKSEGHSIYFSNYNSSELNRLSLDQKFIQISCGNFHFAAISQSQNLYVWGKGNEGQLGLGDGVYSIEDPTIVSIYSSDNQILNSKSIFCGSSQTAVITQEDSHVYLFGKLPCGNVCTPTLHTFDDKPRKVKSVTFGDLTSIVYFILECENVSRKKKKSFILQMNLSLLYNNFLFVTNNFTLSITNFLIYVKLIFFYLFLF